MGVLNLGVAQADKLLVHAVGGDQQRVVALLAVVSRQVLEEVRHVATKVWVAAANEIVKLGSEDRRR